MKYIITGATGHIGNNLTRYLLGKNEQVKIMIRNQKDQSIINLDCEKALGDVTDRTFLERAIEENSVVIHSAGIIDITNKHLDKMLEVNVKATIDIVQECIKKHCKLIYISSTDALIPINGIVSEPSSFPLEGLDNYYAITKAMASDYVLKALNQGLIKGTIVCPSCVLGINDFKVSSQGSVVKNQINKKIGFNIKGHYNFVDVEAICAGIYQASLKNDLKPVYLFSGVDVAVKELYLAIFKATNKKSHFIYVPMFLARFAAIFTPIVTKVFKKKPVLTKMALDTITLKMTFDNSLAISDLSLPVTSIDELIVKTVNWFKDYQTK